MDLIRLSVNMNPETADALRETAARLGISYTEAVRRSVAVFAFVTEERAQGNRILVDSGSSMREVVIL